MGAVLLILAFSQVWTTYALAREVAAQQKTAPPALPPAVATLLSPLYRSEIIAALTVMGLGLLVMAAAGMASSESPPSWAVEQDASFARKANLLARIAVVLAWSFLLINAVGFVISGYGRIRGILANRAAAPEKVAHNLIAAVYLGVSGASFIIKPFLVLVLGALLIRILLLVSDRARGAETQSSFRGDRQ
jgi:hypothetical protein